MGISVKDFLTGVEPSTVERISHKPEIFGFLKKHKKLAYTQKEIATEFDMLSPAARGVLVSLVKDGVVRVKICPVTKDGKTKELIHYAFDKDYADGAPWEKSK